MSASQRWDAAQRAMQKGAEAFASNLSRDANPYKQGGKGWSLHPWWAKGYRDAATNNSDKVSPS